MKDLLIAFVHVFAMMAPWLVFGFLMAGIIAVWIPRNWVNRMMGGSSGIGGILRAVAIGVPLPICSCGVLPIATGLRKHGAGKGPTAAQTAAKSSSLEHHATSSLARHPRPHTGCNNQEIKRVDASH